VSSTNESKLRYYHRKAGEHIAQGRTSHGKARTRVYLRNIPPDQRAEFIRQRNARYWQNRKAKFHQRGLATTGKPYRRIQIPKALRADIKREHQRRLYQERSEKYHSAGLTTRGTAPIYSQFHLTSWEVAWRKMRTQFGACEAPSLWDYKKSEQL